MFFNTLILALSSSIDAVGIGITYGLKKTKFSFFSRVIFFIVSLTATSCSLFFASILKKFISQSVANLIGAFLIMGIGSYTIISNFKKTSSNNFDFDNSNDINLKEAFILSLSLTTDSICVGVGGSMIGINTYLFPLLVASIHLTFLLLGEFLGKNLSSISKLPNRTWTFISGFLLIIIGCTRLI